MNIKQDIRPISYIKSHAADVLKQVNETQRPIYITQNGIAKAVLIDSESYESMQKALGILKLLTLGEKDYNNKKFKKQSQYFNEVEKKLKDLS